VVLFEVEGMWPKLNDGSRCKRLPLLVVFVLRSSHEFCLRLALRRKKNRILRRRVVLGRTGRKEGIERTDEDERGRGWQR
jgi:hypothetical protein